MPWIKNTGCKYHTQDTGYYCSAASSMMVLAEIGVGYASLDQDDLYNSIHSHNAQSGWYGDAEGIRYTLVDRKPASFGQTFVVYKPATEAEGSRKLVYTLQHYGVSPITLVYGCAHWIVVCGVQTDVNPDTGTYTIQGFWLNNPHHEDNEPHAAADICGSGGSHGIENNWTSYDNWQDDFFTGCDWDSTTATKQYISVCDPDEPRIAPPRATERVRYFDGRGVADIRRIPEVVAREIERYSLAQMEQTARVARGRLGTPLLVDRIDVENHPYYLVPSLARTNLLGYLQVDARYGNLLSVLTLKRPMKLFETDRRQLATGLRGLRAELPDWGGRFRFVDGKYRIEKNLVWRPCQQSYSPHLPFWQITIGSYTIYQRVDGRLFTQLTIEGKGD
jgi:hypothetical protein